MKDLDIREKADLLRLLGHPTRLLILEELARGVKCVTDIRDLLDIPQPNVSQHLAVLRQARLVDFYEDGQLRCYYLLRPALVGCAPGVPGGRVPGGQTRPGGCAPRGPAARATAGPGSGL